jgi:hypothetical protein
MGMSAPVRWACALAVLGLLAVAGNAGAEPRCFGAAARDPLHPCDNPRLRLSVTPSPSEALRLPNAPCTPYHPDDVPPTCAFGVAEADAVATIALVGDSHASHWRPALQAVALANRWHGVSIAHSSCPLSRAARVLPGADGPACAEWKRQVFRWFAGHPEVSIVFVSELSGEGGVVATGGRSAFATNVAGYRAAWRALPRTVQHVVVIRDTPKAPAGTGGCIEWARAAGRPPGTACATPRAVFLSRDPAATAAAEARSARIATIDLTHFFCDRARCYPVIGGALVNKDETHMTATYGATLGPYLLRALRQLMRTWR